MRKSSTIPDIDEIRPLLGKHLADCVDGSQSVQWCSQHAGTIGIPEGQDPQHTILPGGAAAAMVRCQHDDLVPCAKPLDDVAAFDLVSPPHDWGK